MLTFFAERIVTQHSVAVFPENKKEESVPRKHAIKATLAYFR